MISVLKAETEFYFIRSSYSQLSVNKMSGPGGQEAEQ
jgi:hypothetical protein